MRVCGLEFSSETIHQVRQAIEDTPSISRRSLARQVCERMGWRASNGKLKEAVCRKALGVLAKESIIDLSQSPGTCARERAGKAQQPSVVECIDIACDLSELGPIEIERVASRYSKASV